MPTKIEWCDEVWNPITGCAPVSAGCAHCYAAAIAHRFWGDRPFSEVRCHPERLGMPLRWKKPRRIFAGSMTDLFHPDIPSEFLCHVFGMMHSTPRHTYLVLTKRPEGLRKFIIDHGLWPYEGGSTDCGEQWPLPNVHIGVSVEDQRTADERVPALLGIPAAVRWVSAEPLLGPVDLGLLGTCAKDWGLGYSSVADHLTWVVSGAETGPKAGPCLVEWARSLRDQCAAAGVPFLWKSNGPKDRTGGRLLDGVLHDAYPEGMA